MAQIQVLLAGVYHISFSIYTNAANPQDWGIAVNGIVISEFNSSGQTINAAATLILNANDIITIRNVATVPNPAVLRIGAISAYAQVYKLS